jgi:L-2-hydroxyglutarate oxidase LhgO
VSDPNEITKALASNFMRKGGRIHLLRKAELSIKHDEVYLLNSEIQGKHVINCAGVFANELARSIGINTNYLLIPFLGTYSKTTNENLGLKTLVYPVPNPVNPFLGNHFTLTLDDKVKIGPSAIPLFGKEQYKLFQGFNMKDMLNTTKGLIRFSQSNFQNLLDIAKSEIPKLHSSALRKNASKLVPQILHQKN